MLNDLEQFRPVEVATVRLGDVRGGCRRCGGNVPVPGSESVPERIRGRSDPGVRRCPSNS